MGKSYALHMLTVKIKGDNVCGKLSTEPGIAFSMLPTTAVVTSVIKFPLSCKGRKDPYDQISFLTVVCTIMLSIWGEMIKLSFTFIHSFTHLFIVYLKGMGFKKHRSYPIFKEDYNLIEMDRHIHTVK